MLTLNYFQYMLHRYPLELVHCQHWLYKLLEPTRNIDMWGEFDLALHPLHQHIDIFSLLPRIDVVEYFVEHNTKTPHIAFDCVRFPQYNLRRHVNWGSHTRLSSRTILHFLLSHHLCKPKVRKLKKTFIKSNLPFDTKMFYVFRSLW